MASFSPFRSALATSLFRTMRRIRASRPCSKIAKKMIPKTKPPIPASSRLPEKYHIRAMLISVYAVGSTTQGSVFFSRPVDMAMRPVCPFIAAVTPLSLYKALIKYTGSSTGIVIRLPDCICSVTPLVCMTRSTSGRKSSCTSCRTRFSVWASEMSDSFTFCPAIKPYSKGCASDQSKGSISFRVRLSSCLDVLTAVPSRYPSQ